MNRQGQTSGAPRRVSATLWTAPQRAVLIALLGCLLLLLGLQFLLNPLYVSDPQPRDPPRALELADRVDPNTADWQTLAALPMIGEKRARDIIAYRDQFTARNPGQIAFTRIEDLFRIRGFGPAMIAHVRPYLIFPQPPTPATRPD